MAHTSLHRAVGASAGRITVEILKQAVTAQLGEADDLDWKQDSDDTKDNREVAKDFAAMANAVGGVIVTGVSEDGDGHATGLPGVDQARAVALSNKYRAVAGALVRPFIPALRVYTVELGEPSGKYAVVVEIPRSPEAPHLVMWEQMSWRCPRRNDSDTVWLGETELEAAYARRFAGRLDVQAQLVALADDVRERVVVDQRGVWVVVTACCSMPASYDAMPTVNPRAADPVMTEILGMMPDGESLLRGRLRNAVPTVGLRRSIFTPSRPDTGQSIRARLSLHHDGSFAGALDASSNTTTGIVLLPQLYLESAVRDLVTAAAVHASRRGGDGTLQIRAEIYTDDRFALAERDGRYDEQIGGSIALNPSGTARGPIPVLTEAPLEELISSPTHRSSAANALSLDLIHQFAVPNLLGREGEPA